MSIPYTTWLLVLCLDAAFQTCQSLESSSVLQFWPIILPLQEFGQANIRIWEAMGVSEASVKIQGVKPENV